MLGDLELAELRNRTDGEAEKFGEPASPFQTPTSPARTVRKLLIYWDQMTPCPKEPGRMVSTDEWDACTARETFGLPGGR